MHLNSSILLENIRNVQTVEVSWKVTKLQVSVKDEIVTISCECGFLKLVDENNKEIKK